MTSPLPEPPHDESAIQERASALSVRDFNRPWKAPFLEAFALSGNVADAARRVGISREHAWRERHLDPVFDEAWKEADEIGTDFLELIGWRRATVGEPRRVTKVKYNEKGVEVERVVEESSVISNALLITLLKARRPERYRERYEHKVVGDPTAPIRVEIERVPTRQRMLDLARLARELELPETIEGEAIDEDEAEESL